MSEVTIFPVKLTLSSAIATATRPTTLSVISTSAALGSAGAVFSALIYDAGTDASPAHAEAIQVTSGGGTLTWTFTTESGSTAQTHANGSTVLATVLTPRSIGQPLLDHVTLATTADPHVQYMRKNLYLNKGDLLVGAGLGTVVRLPATTVDGVPLLSASTFPLGVRWGGTTVGYASAALSATTNLASGPGGANLAATAGIYTVAVAPGLVQIATLVADGLTTLTFNSIPPFRNLQLTGSARSSAAVLQDSLSLRCNADNTQTYNTQNLKVIGTTITANQIDVAANAMTVADIPGSPSTYFGIPLSLVIEMPNAGVVTTAKGILARSNSIASGGITSSISIEYLVSAGTWRPVRATPITSLTLSLATGPFAIGSTFVLWGQS